MQEYLAKTFQGLEPVLADELRLLGAKNIEVYNRAVAFEGDTALLYRANLALRTALRILLPLGSAQVRDQKELYEFTRSINFLRYFTPDETFAVFPNVQKSQAFPHSGFAGLKVKDAIVDQFRDYRGRRPSVDKELPKIGIHLHMYGEQATLFLDSSGESLHRRGYRRGGHPAPLSEVLAAGIVLLSGWNPETPLLDGMCGSGTLLTEAALWAKNLAPNRNRNQFGFQHWKDFDAQVLTQVRVDLAEAERLDLDLRLHGWDLHPLAIEEARINAEAAGVDEDLRLSQGDFFLKEPPKLGEQGGMLLINPPYGERLEAGADMESFYRRVGDRLKQAYSGYRAGIFSANLLALKQLGLKPSEKFALHNAQLPAQLAIYELYRGRREA